MKLSPLQVQSLIDQGCLKVLSVEKTPRDRPIDPVGFKDGTWLEASYARIEADLGGTPINTSYDPNLLNAPQPLFQKLQARDTSSNPAPTLESVVAQALAQAIPLAWPDLSNHTRLCVLKILEAKETPEDE
jgi:hypothetical protein